MINTEADLIKALNPDYNISVLVNPELFIEIETFKPVVIPNRTTKINFSFRQYKKAVGKLGHNGNHVKFKDGLRSINFFKSLKKLITEGYVMIHEDKDNTLILRYCNWSSLDKKFMFKLGG